MTAHAIGNDCERDAAAFWVRQQRDAVLLLSAVARVLGDAGVKYYGHREPSPNALNDSIFAASKDVRGQRRLGGV
jgi:hypothetical protein